MKKETIHLDWVLNSFYDFIYLLIHTGEGGRRSQRDTSLYKRNTGGLPPVRPHVALDPGMGPDCESNGPPISSQAGSQSTEPHQQELSVILRL